LVDTTENKLVRATSDLMARVQRLETEQLALRAQIEAGRQLLASIAHIVAAAQTALVVGASVERFAEAMRAPFRLRLEDARVARAGVDRVALF
jgi:hypothetical protein